MPGIATQERAAGLWWRALHSVAAGPYGWRMPTVTEEFCAAMLGAARGPLGPAVARATGRSLLNVLGTAVSAGGSDAVRVLLAAADEAGGAGDVTVPGLARTLDPYWAALVTGTAAHLDDFDDTHLATVIHPGAAALAAVLALVPETTPSGAAFLGAFAAGCEAQLRIGCAISPAHYDHGWHITGTTCPGCSARRWRRPRCTALTPRRRPGRCRWPRR